MNDNYFSKIAIFHRGKLYISYYLNDVYAGTRLIYCRNFLTNKELCIHFFNSLDTESDLYIYLKELRLSKDSSYLFWEFLKEHLTFLIFQKEPPLDRI